MASKDRARYVLASLAAVVCLALMMGANCIPVVPDDGNGGTDGNGTTGPTTLVSETFSFVPPDRNFNPSAAGQTITATVSGNATGSRIQVIITDFATGNVVAQELLPTTNSTTVPFVSTNNGVHVLASNEIGTGSATYTVNVTEQ
jgi:hypothetical protein